MATGNFERGKKLYETWAARHQNLLSTGYSVREVHSGEITYWKGKFDTSFTMRWGSQDSANIMWYLSNMTTTEWRYSAATKLMLETYDRNGGPFIEPEPTPTFTHTPISDVAPSTEFTQSPSLHTEPNPNNATGAGAALAALALLLISSRK